ncbi:uncharacterized protein NMK_2378 [Novimethylophilus kurashikiensis]|uniref:Lycopene cyclase domain-containing protein n=1 Tax=Novimethylophilus kurashikiensis TaxID=1825523 RepID=A0A2R5F9A4_9PROT|nr:lycopene cyclase domain-containing protein [Novimethylophilus kurashikiensis]GBG14777.1 uncharacterized protein NMK_2378 [Novimethylophilus kurashikiensis]
MIQYQYVWLLWASLFLIPWLVLYVMYPQHRKVMWLVSLATMPFGLTEPLFVPEYWNPPTLLNLAQRTGFDLESLIFCFGIGGVGSVLYSVFVHQNDVAVVETERQLPLHRHHYKALLSPIVVFLALYFFPWSPIYPSIIAMAVGAFATIACRPDLKTKTWIGGLLFLGYYFVFFLGLVATSPGYVERVWNLPTLSGVLLLGIPLEELLFALSFGLYWSGVYEHLMWRQLAPLHNHSKGINGPGSVASGT